MKKEQIKNITNRIKLDFRDQILVMVDDESLNVLNGLLTQKELEKLTLEDKDHLTNLLTDFTLENKLI